MSRFTGSYSADWRKVNAAVCESAGHRCVRCGHPYKKGTHGRGEWTPCDEKCRHGGLVRIAEMSTCETPVIGQTYAQWRILTCHHFDGDKSNNAWWNLMVLCQRCHLQIQRKVNPDTPYFFQHSDWIKPYVAGFYGKKYLDKDLSREETMARLDELLALECRV